MEEALKIFPDYFKTVNKKPIVSNFTWIPLDNKKITNFLLHQDKVVINENDEKIKENTFKKLFTELVRYKDIKQSNFKILNSIIHLYSRSDVRRRYCS